MSNDYFEGNISQWENSELLEEYTQLMQSKRTDYSLAEERRSVRRAIVDRMNGNTYYEYDRRVEDND